MNDELAEQSQGERRRVALGSLYLDPNNYRFVDHPDYRKVKSDDVFEADVQRRTTNFVLGRNQANVRDLIASFKENGWLELDSILVEKQGRRYLVVEGNRRVATLKHLQQRYDEDAIELGRLDPAIFSKLTVVLHQDADEHHHLLMMGLHHISGKRRWPAVSRAMAIKRLHEHLHGDADAVCNSLGISKREFNLSIRALALVAAYRESDFGDQFKSDQFNLFREVLASPSIRNWLDWDNGTYRAGNEANLERLFQWMSTEPEPEDDDDNDTSSLEGAEGGVRSVGVDPVLTTVSHVRELARIIDDPKAVKELEETRSLQQATLSSEILVKNDIDRAFDSCDRGLEKLTSQVGRLEGDDLDRVSQIIGRFQGLALAHKRRPPGDSTDRIPWEPFNESRSSQFSAVRVGAYRGITGISLDGLRRINLIAGVNNAGKTSVLEAVHLLSHQNDETALLDAMRWRGRWEGPPDPNWLVDQIPEHIRVSGDFDQVENNSAEVDVQRRDEADDRIGDQASFLTTYRIESRYGSWIQSTDVALFSDRPHRAHFDGRHWLCRCSLTSPFGANRVDALVKANEAALEAGTKAQVIDFIKENIDSRMINIELADEQRRFLVTHLDFQQAPDLSSFGDGLRRVFEIGLLLASVRDGVLLIDEFESAIHPQLLRDFTRIVQELADELNVQVFLTTHSKEALDAFITNNYRTEDIAAYALRRGPEGIDVRRFDGNQLLLLHEAADFDLRGVVA